MLFVTREENIQLFLAVNNINRPDPQRAPALPDQVIKLRRHLRLDLHVHVLLHFVNENAILDELFHRL